MTLFADHPGTLSASLLLPTAIICFIFPPHQPGTPLPSSASGTFSTRTAPTLQSPDSPNDKKQTAPSRVRETTRLPALSSYRAHMMLVTVLAILAVDFPVFPRALAKCETYGVSFVRPVFFLLRIFNLLMGRCLDRWTWASAHSYSPMVLSVRTQSSSGSNIQHI